MKTYLPHYFKRIGILFVFIAIVLSCIGAVDDFRQGWVDGGNSADHGYKELKAHPELYQTINPYLTDEEVKLYVSISLLFSILGFLMYLFSKEKIDDEYIQHIRLKSIFQSLLVSWLIYAAVKLIFPKYQLDGIYILQMQLIVYVILFQHNKSVEFSEEEIALEN